MKNVLVLGSTGSMGRQTLDIIRKYSHKFNVIGLSCHTNARFFEKQMGEFKPEYGFCTFNDGHFGLFQEAVSKTDIVVNAIVGSAGFPFTCEAVKQGKEILLANKESLILGGSELLRVAGNNGARLIPLDSEHHAISQCLSLSSFRPKTVYLTCSGGPFYGKTEEELQYVTPEQAIRHPIWKMGQKISVDSATLMNKGFEIIEAMYLFHLSPEQIKVKIHPQSLVHAMVEFEDGVTLAKIAPANMRIVIEEALTGIFIYPPKVFDLNDGRYELSDPVPSSLTQGIYLGYQAALEGGNLPRKFCLANEQAVARFLAGQIRFLEIYQSAACALKSTTSAVF